MHSINPPTGGPADTSMPIDWEALGRRLVDAIGDMTGPRTDTFFAEALRRAFGYRSGDERNSTYDAVDPATGLITKAEHVYTLDTHTIIDRAGRETAERRVTELHAELRAARRDGRREAGEWLRGYVGEGNVPSRLRREGVLLAAEWLAPQRPSQPANEPTGAGLTGVDR